MRLFWPRLRQSIEKHKGLFEAVQAIATIVALVVGAIWTYALTRQYRETVPRLAIKQNASSWILHDSSTLLRVDSIITNDGKVRIDGVNEMRMIVLRILPETKEQAAAFSAGKMWFDCQNSPGKDCVPEQGLNLPASSTRLFVIKDLAGGVEPGERVPYWRYMHFDGDVKTVEVYTVIEKPSSGHLSFLPRFLKSAREEEDWIFDETFDLKHQSEGAAGSKQ
jgi:hypothetical protein